MVDDLEQIALNAIRYRAASDNDGKAMAQIDRRWLLGYIDAHATVCPPHDFNPGWTKDTNADGVLFCSMCGDIRLLVPPTIEAPAAESIPSKPIRRRKP